MRPKHILVLLEEVERVGELLIDGVDYIVGIKVVVGIELVWTRRARGGDSRVEKALLEG